MRTRPSWWRWKSAGWTLGAILWIGVLVAAGVGSRGPDWAAHFPAQLARAAVAVPVGALIAGSLDYALFRDAVDSARVAALVLLFPLPFTVSAITRVGRLNQWEIYSADPMLFLSSKPGKGPLDPIDDPDDEAGSRDWAQRE